MRKFHKIQQGFGEKAWFFFFLTSWLSVYKLKLFLPRLVTQASCSVSHLRGEKTGKQQGWQIWVVTMSVVLGCDTARLLELQKGQAAFQGRVGGLASSKAYVAWCSCMWTSAAAFRQHISRKTFAYRKDFRKRAVGMAGEIITVQFDLH